MLSGSERNIVSAKNSFDILGIFFLTESQSALQVYQGPPAASVSVSQHTHERTRHMTHKYTHSSQTTEDYQSSHHEYRSSQRGEYQLSFSRTEAPYSHSYYVVETVPRYEYATTNLYDNYDTSYLSDYDKSLQHTHLHSTPLTAQVSRILREHQAIRHIDPRTAYSLERDMPTRHEYQISYQAERPASVSRGSHMSRRDHQVTRSHQVIQDSVQQVQQQVTSRQIQGFRSR